MRLVLSLGCVLLARVALAASGEVDLTAEKDLKAWREPTGAWMVVADATLKASDRKKLELKSGQGAIANGPDGRTSNLLSREEFGDCQVHVEFLISKESNSGVYLMGRYEVQIYDSFGKEKDAYPGIECGGIYPRWMNEHNENGHSPRVNASKPPGQWQTFDITFRAPRFDAAGKKIANGVFVQVVHNGKVIHENVEVTGPTRAADFDDEKPAGPLMLQGDHGPVVFRNLRVRAIAPTDRH
jgi:hypothetical protein